MKRLVIACTCALALGLVAAPPKAQPKGQGRSPQQQQKARKVQAQQKARPAAGQPNRFNVSQGGRGGRGMQSSHHRMGMQGAGRHSQHRERTGFHAGRPEGARYWDRPGVPPRMAGALRDWYWVSTPWAYTVDGAYYYGEGYYFDGYNYCYNGGYHLVPPPTTVVTQPVVTQPVVTQPVVTQPVVTQPVVTQPTPPPPPKRGGGLLNMLFGN